MTSCWAQVPDRRPSMHHVVEVMNELITGFPGADEALEYEFVEQQVCNLKIKPLSRQADLIINYY